MEKRLFTSECVTNGHPDKVADSISDAILDACLAQDPHSRVACETMVTTNFCIICGEITTKATVDYAAVAREAIRKIGYVYPGDGFDADTVEIQCRIHTQSADIALGTNDEVGGAGDHPAWGSKVFDYGKNGVVHFLLSNVRFWLEEYHFDGFRFDGVTSMIYLDHGLGSAFTDYRQYFSMNTDVQAVAYLQLAAELTHEFKRGALCVAEEMSGMPGMCLPVKEGGIGFDYRLSMGLPDYFIKTIREKQDGQWNMGRLYYELISRRPGEKNIAYCESHDQALVGDKTLMFRLADKEMYWGMNRGYENMVVERAVALHKMIRLVTIAAGGEGYLNFMGNEFGHPEWIDFPREGNDWSFAHARRLWSLAENGYLRYELLGNFDKAMIAMIKKYDVLEGGMPRCLRQHEDDQILAFEKKGCVFVFNFHPTRSQTGLFVPVPENGDYQVVLSTDDKVFGGYQNIDKTVIYHTWAHDPQMGDGFVIYLPARTAVVLRKVEKKKD